eukprot:gene5351-9159_t
MKDIEFFNFLNQNKIKFQIILTKNDLVFPDVLEGTLANIEASLGKYSHCILPVLLSSSKSNSGVLEIQKIISGFIERKKLSKLKDIGDKFILNEK